MSSADKLLNNIEWLTPEHRAEFVAALLALLEAEAVEGFLTADDMFTRAKPRQVKAIPLERIKELLGG